MIPETRSFIALASFALNALENLWKCCVIQKINEASVFLSCADASYMDPLGPEAERPKKGAKNRVMDYDFADEELGEDLLPE